MPPEIPKPKPLGQREVTDLILDENSTEAVEKLKRGDYMALNKERGCDGCGGPPAGADGHFVEPLFQWKLSKLATGSGGGAEHVVHIHG